MRKMELWGCRGHMSSPSCSPGAELPFECPSKPRAAPRGQSQVPNPWGGFKSTPSKAAYIERANSLSREKKKEKKYLFNSIRIAEFGLLKVH